MNGTLNVVTDFAVGVSYDFHDPEFKAVVKYIDTIFSHLQPHYIHKALTGILPDFLMQRKICRIFLNSALPGL